MKSVLMSVVLFGMLLPAQAADDRWPLAELDQLGAKVFLALQSGSKADLAALCLLEKEEMLALARRNAPEGEKERAAFEEAMEAMKKNIDGLIQKQKRLFDAGWSQLLDDVKKNGIDMAKATYVGIDARIVPYKGNSYVKIVRIVFQSEDKFFAIVCSDVYRTGVVWKLEDAPSRLEKWTGWPAP